MSGKDHRNVLITSSNFPRGSASANFLNLFCRGVVLSGRSIEVYLLKGFFLGGRKTSDAKSNLTNDGVKYTYLNFVNRPSGKFLKLTGDIYAFFRLTFLLFSLIGRRKHTTVFAYNNELYHSILLNCIGKVAGIKVVTFVPEYYDISEFSGSITQKLRWYGFLLNFHYINRLSDRLIVFSSFIKSRYIGMNYPEGRILVQPNLTDFDFWKSVDNDIIYTIGYSGTPYKKDGIEDLLTAISILRKRGVKINAVIVGDVVNEKSIIPSLISFCRNLGIEDAVEFTGLVSLEEVRSLLNNCKILALTRPDIVQTNAGFPTKLGEYFACGKIVLSTKIGDAGSYFSDRDEIVFAKAGNPDSIADNLEWILNHKLEVNGIVENGYRRADELLNYKKLVPSMMEFVERTV